MSTNGGSQGASYSAVLSAGLQRPSVDFYLRNKHFWTDDEADSDLECPKPMQTDDGTDLIDNVEPAEEAMDMALPVDRCPPLPLVNHDHDDLKEKGDSWPAKRVLASASTLLIRSDSDTSLPPVKPPRRRISSALSTTSSAPPTDTITSKYHSDHVHYSLPVSPARRHSEHMTTCTGDINQVAHQSSKMTSSKTFVSEEEHGEPRLYLYRRNSSLDSLEDGHTSLSNSISLNDIGLNSNVSHGGQPVLLTPVTPDLEISPKRNKLVNLFSNKKAKMVKSMSTQTPTKDTWSRDLRDPLRDRDPTSYSTTNSYGKALTIKLQEPFISWEEQFARRLFIGRRCWSFMSRGHQKYSVNGGATKVNFNSNSRTGSTAACEGKESRTDTKSGSLMTELKRLRYQNEELQQQLKKVTERLEQIAGHDEVSSSEQTVSTLMASIIEAQQARELALTERFQVANSDRDLACRQLTELVDVLLQPNEYLDGQSADHQGGHGQLDSSGSEPEEDEQAYEFAGSSSASGAVHGHRRPEDDIEKLKEKVTFTRMQLKHEIKLRLIQEKKSRRLERVVNSLHEKVASFHF